MEAFTAFDRELATHIYRFYKWIARSANGEMYLFTNKPFKKQNVWICKNGETTLLPNYGVFESIKYEDDEPTLIEDIYDPHALNNKEKEYLRDVFRPFKNRVSQVIKKHSAAITNAEFIAVKLTDDVDSFTLPYFEENKMYVGMESEHPYSLSELGIVYD